MRSAERLESAFSAGISRRIRMILERAADQDISASDALALSSVVGAELHALAVVADELRANQVGDAVTYVVNRNINFTNVCTKACHFCAFSRTQRSEEAYFLNEDEIVRRAVEAHALGATEVCLQAGLAPSMTGREYSKLCRAIKSALPEIHIHAFSPEEIKYGAHLSRMTIADYLAELRDSGLGSVPGTSAEILDDTVRARLGHGRISTAEWVDVITTAHRLGIRTTSTMMFGHIESARDRAEHLALLRSIQLETGGITEFVPLSFVHHEAPLNIKHSLPDLKPGPSGNDVVRLFAIARLMLGRTIPNIQVSWVKEGARFGQWLLSCGANDLGGTLMNESISTSAGASHGQLMTPKELRAAIRDCGRTPVERTTLYAIRKVFTDKNEVDDEGPLDTLQNPDETFGSYSRLIHDERYRFQKPKKLRVIS